MQRMFYVLLCCALAAGVSIAQIAAPTNLTVAAMRGANGQQYFHVSFDRIASDSSASGTVPYIVYHILRWQGAVPDTTNRAQAQEISNYNGNASTPVYFDDDNSSFNPDYANPNYVRTYSYAVYAVEFTRNTNDSMQTSPLSPLVSADLDSIYLYFTKVPSSSVTASVGQTFTWQFTALPNIGTPGAITYSASSNNTDVAAATIDANGNLTAAVKTYGAAAITVTGIDAAGRGANCTFTIESPVVMDTIQVSLLSYNLPHLPAGTRYYYYLDSPSSNPDTNAQGGYGRGTGILGDNGTFTVAFPKLTTYLRVAAEGYAAAWINDNTSRRVDVSANGNSYSVMLAPATMHTISGTVTDGANQPLSGATLKLLRYIRPFPYNIQELQLDTASADANGAYTFSVPEGDSILETTNVSVTAYAAGYYDSPKNSGYLSSQEDHDSVNFQFNVTHLTYKFSVTLKTAAGEIIRVPALITAYALTDTGVTIAGAERYRYDSIAAAGFTLNPGSYIFFAQPDSGYLSGYYSRSGYAATWQQADTVVIAQVNYDEIAIILPQDSSIAQQSGGTQIDGTVNTGSGGTLDNTHLLLYQGISGAAGGTQDRLYKTTMTDATGSYSFGNLSAGTYAIYVDPVGQPIYKLTGIVVSGADTVVHQDITDNTVAVAEPLQSIPAMIALAQNYPNPFSGTTNVEFRIPNEELVTLNVYNALGEKVATLAHGVESAGAHSAEFNAGGLPAGVYSYVLRMNGAVASRRMSVVR